MSEWMAGFAVAVAFGLLALFLAGRRNERRVQRDWALALTPRGARVYSSLEERFHGEMALLQTTYDEAFAMKELDSMEEARELLEIGYRVLEQFAPSLLKLLGAMATFSHMVSALAPVPPVPPRRFRLSALTSVALLGQGLHHFLVTSGERFRLRLYILGRGVGLVARYALRATRRVVAGGGRDERDWDQIRAIRSDLETLTDESLLSLKTLLAAMAAEKKDAYDVIFREGGPEG